VSRGECQSFSTILLISIWFGIVSGLVEGCGLILFQRLNWQSWGAMLHVSAPIIWVSPVVDVALFVVMGCLVGIAGKINSKFPPFTVLVFVLSFLTAYDWLTLTGRLYHLSCLLLAIGVAAMFTRWAIRNEAVVTAFWKRSIAALVVVTLVTFAAIHWGSKWQEQRTVKGLPVAAPGSPNVLVIIIDTLRADHVHAYRYARETTPNIDQLANQGVLFENAISPTPWSLPSHVSLLTGRYQFEHGIADIPAMSALGLQRSAMNGFTTIGEVHEKHGYRTAAFSANRVNFTANLGFQRGFQHFEDYFQSPADAFLRTVYGKEFSRIYLNRTEHSKIKRLLRWIGFNSLLDKSDEGSIKQLGALGVQKRADAVNDELLRWIDQHGRSRPFFAFLNYIDVHHPYGGPAWFDRPWKGSGVNDQYDSGVKYVDDRVGDLMRELQKRGLDRNTLVVITSDHGESLGEHNIAFHGESLYREQVHVPLIFWFPGHVPAGARLPSLVSNASIPATLVSVLKFAPVADFQRPAIDGLWKNSQPVNQDEILSEVAQLYPASEEDIVSQKTVPVSMDGPMKSLITPDWQLIEHAKFGNQLYNYAIDPGESRDLFWSANSQSTAGDLLIKMQTTTAGQLSAQSATPMGNGVSGLNPNALYRIVSIAGSVLKIELRRTHDSPLPAIHFESVLSIANRDGKLFQTCRNYADDNIPRPGVPDPTPLAFDDVCTNTPVVSGGSKLDILVPGIARTPVELYVRVSDWDGRAIPHGFQIAVSVAAASN
jgi:arylsulfatase A-like enzyme